MGTPGRSRTAAAIVVAIGLVYGGMLAGRAVAAPKHTVWQADLAALKDGYGHFVVTLRPAASIEGATGVVRATRVQGDVYAVKTTLTRAQVGALPGVAAVEDDVPVGITTNDPGYTQQWALQNTGQNVNGAAGSAGADVKAPAAWPRPGATV